MTINFNKPLDDPSIADSVGGVMPVGEYLGVIDSAEEATSKSGKDMIKLVVKLRGNEKYDGKLLFHYLVFDFTSPDAEKRTLEQSKKLMMALNQDITGLKQISADKLAGLPCKVKTKHEEYNGDMTDKIHFFAKLDADDTLLVKAKSGQSNDEEIDLGDDVPF